MTNNKDWLTKLIELRPKYGCDLNLGKCVVRADSDEAENKVKDLFSALRIETHEKGCRFLGGCIGIEGLEDCINKK